MFVCIDVCANDISKYINMQILPKTFILLYLLYLIIFLCFLASSSVANVKVQAQAPNFEGKAIVNGEIKNISLTDFAGKYLVLFFYPLDL